MSLEQIFESTVLMQYQCPVAKLFHAAGPATLNARLQRRRLVRETTRSPKAMERTADRVETVDTGTRKSCM